MSASRADELVELNDRRLEPLLRASGLAAEREIERLIVAVARPLVHAILARQPELSPEDAADVAANVQLRLVTKLRDVAAAADEAVHDFEKYVAALTYNAVNDHFRKSFPARARLKNRIRYFLTRDPRLALWSSGGRMLCGLRAWSGSAHAFAAVEADFDRLPRAVLDRRRVGDALAALFESLGHPVQLDGLVAFAADAWHVTDPVAAVPEAAAPAEESAGAQLEARDYLRALWREIVELRPMQRKALLLNLRSNDAADVVALFVLTGVAAFDELAAALDLTHDGLAAIWNELPFDDRRIASELGLTRQQVINLRKSARERLARRMGHLS